MLREYFEDMLLELGLTMEEINAIEEYGKRLLEQEEYEFAEEDRDFEAQDLAMQYMFDNMIDQLVETCRKYLKEEIGLNCSSSVIKNVISRMEVEW